MFLRRQKRRKFDQRPVWCNQSRILSWRAFERFSIKNEKKRRKEKGWISKRNGRVKGVSTATVIGKNLQGNRGSYRGNPFNGGVLVFYHVFIYLFISYIYCSIFNKPSQLLSLYFSC